MVGQSWLNHLHRTLDETSMGKTGHLGPPPLSSIQVSEKENSREVQELTAGAAKRHLLLNGADLYRLNCRGCHGEFGLGAPPEINSVIDATRATYAAFTHDRLKQLGMETTRAEAATLAKGAKGALFERLHQGGVDMPPFPHLNDAEVRAIFEYLRELAEIPGAEKQQSTTEESPVRVGEHIVKSTCHTCHNAVGGNPGPDELMQGAIPALSTLTTRVSLPEFVRKVRYGAPILMGSPLLPYRGRMPVFYYLSENEVTDAYLYLKFYPPTPGFDPGNPPEQSQAAARHELPKNPPHSKVADSKEVSFPLLVEVLVGLLIAGGGIFTVYEMKRLKVGKPSVPIDEALIQNSSPGATKDHVAERRSPSILHWPRQDAHKQAGWHSPVHLSKYHVFESSWLSRQFENKKGPA